MAKTSKNTLKSWFQNGDYPNQEQFWAWMDSYWHKDEDIDIARINQLTQLLTSKATYEDIVNLNQRIDDLPNFTNSAVTERVEYAADFEYTLASGTLLEKVVIIPASDIMLSIGSTHGSEDVMITQVFDAMFPAVILLDQYAHVGDKHLFFAGISVHTQMIFYKRL
jgi:hypothetical protein